MSDAMSSDSGPEYPTLPPEKLLDGNIHQIKAGLNCIDSVEMLKNYMAHENRTSDRTPIQEAIRMRACEIRSDASSDGDETPRTDAAE